MMQTFSSSSLRFRRRSFPWDLGGEKSRELGGNHSQFARIFGRRHRAPELLEHLPLTKVPSGSEFERLRNRQAIVVESADKKRPA